MAFKYEGGSYWWARGSWHSLTPALKKFNLSQKKIYIVGCHFYTTRLFEATTGKLIAIEAVGKPWHKPKFK